MTAPTSQARPTKDRPSLAQLGNARPRLRAVAVAPLLTVVPAGFAVGAAVALAPAQARVPLGWGLGAALLLLCTAVAVAGHASQTSRLLLRRLETVSQDAGRLLQEKAALTEESAREQARLTDEFTRERARLAEQNAHQKVRLAAELDRERTRLGAENARVTDELRQARTDRATAISASASTAGRLQALATSMLADLRAMEERHADEDVLADLLHLDHLTAQAGRLADSVAVLTGARSGRRWARPIGMESILRGAMGRIGGYQRVRVHSASEAAVAGHAAEAVMHALAEILDNAANFSPPTAEVHVYVEEVPAGIIVSVEDSGLVMGEAQLRRAELAVSGTRTGLGGLTGARLGLTVVGLLARKYGLTVSFRPSARGGTGVLVRIPQEILATPATAPASPASTSASTSASASASASASGRAAATDFAPTYVPASAPTATPPPFRAPFSAPTQTPTSTPPPLQTPYPIPEPTDTADSTGTTGTTGTADTAGTAWTAGTASPVVRGSSAPFPGPRPGPWSDPDDLEAFPWSGWSGSHGSYATSHAVPDLDPEPVPAHGFRPRPADHPDHSSQFSQPNQSSQPNRSNQSSHSDQADPAERAEHAELLPRRHRGRTLAEAEAASEAAGEATAETAAGAGPAGADRTPDDVMHRATRFNSFRQAVRRPPADEPVQARTSPATPHPEGDPTS
ncbi:ATP-binding protein [Streptomyces dioscori]|uniref:histidine kinase n=1 Tax=Streptomyces dioscori TaxID=2109333 RepID=A0A2P8QE55_9ACTN|nr:ATP-binding protein [Streptomyces dioscori]PSM44514.1 ATP-binding protein [Streptomyces dioscori]